MLDDEVIFTNVAGEALKEFWKGQDKVKLLFLQSKLGIIDVKITSCSFLCCSFSFLHMKPKLKHFQFRNHYRSL